MSKKITDERITVDNPDRAKLIYSRLISETSFARMPASTKYHGAGTGGLMHHSLAVALNLEHMTSCLAIKWGLPSSLFVVALLHDACKIDAYVYNQDYKCWEHNENHPEGHGELSLKVADELGIDLTQEEKLCIRWHMGAFDTEENWKNYSAAVEKYPTVLWTHTADMLAAHVDHK